MKIRYLISVCGQDSGSLTIEIFFFVSHRFRRRHDPTSMRTRLGSGANHSSCHQGLFVVLLSRSSFLSLSLSRAHTQPLLVCSKYERALSLYLSHLTLAHAGDAMYGRGVRTSIPAIRQSPSRPAAPRCAKRLHYVSPDTLHDQVFIISEEDEGGLFKAKAMNEVDAGRDRATPASVGHDADEPLTTISPNLQKQRTTLLSSPPPALTAGGGHLSTRCATVHARWARLFWVPMNRKKGCQPFGT